MSILVFIFSCPMKLVYMVFISRLYVHWRVRSAVRLAGCSPVSHYCPFQLAVDLADFWTPKFPVFLCLLQLLLQFAEFCRAPAWT